MQQTIFSYVNAFLVGGLICAVGQVLIDKTKMSAARILVLFVTLGVLLTSLGLYQKLVDFGGAGATVPLTGFGYSLAKGAFNEVERFGLLGAFTGGIRATAAGIAAAIFFGYLVSITFKPKPKR